MSTEIEVKNEGNVLVVNIAGQLDKDDFQTFTPEVERLIEQHGKVRILMEAQDFEGWDAGAMWEDVKFEVKHFNDIERVAIVGEKKWEKGMAAFCKPFTTAKVQFFGPDQKEEARTWIQESVSS